VRRFWLWIVLVLLLTAAPAAAADVTMTVQPAFGGLAKEGDWVTLWIDLRSEGGAAAGEVVLRVDPPSGLTLLPDARYAVPFDLPAGGSSRQVVSLPDRQGWPLRVELYAGGERVAERTVELDWQPRDVLLAGVLSEGEGLAEALGQLRSGEQAARVVRLSAEEMPDSATLLESFDVIALSRFDTGALSEAQIQALALWVARGGTLLLFGGPEWQRTLGPLPGHLLPVEPAGTAEAPLTPLGEAAGTPLPGSALVSAGPLVRGEALLGDDPVLAAAARVGSGRVIYLAYDPDLAPVADWAGQAALLGQLVGSPAWRLPGLQADWRMQYALQQLPDWGLPRVWLVVLVLGGYLLAAGPVSYLVLRRIDRREWAWFTVPLLALVFLGMVYGLGAGRFQGGITHLITTTELMPGSGAGVMTTHTGVYAPGRTRLSLPLPGARLVRALVMANLGGEVPARIVPGDPAAIELSGLTNYTMAGFAVEQAVSVGGGLELVDLAMTGTELTGRVRNGLPVPLVGVEVATARAAVPLGALGPGETSAPFRLRLQGEPDPGDPKGVLLPPEQLAGAEEDPRRDQVRSYVWEVGEGRHQTALLVLGWTEGPPAEPAVTVTGRLAKGVHAVYAFHPLPVQATADLPDGAAPGRPENPEDAEQMEGGPGAGAKEEVSG